MTPQHWTELDIIRLFSRHCKTGNKQLITGIGDDCAVLQPDGREQWVVTADMLVDTIHFDTSWHPAYQLGRKCLAVNLSDIAAMGAMPQFVLLSLAISEFQDKHWLEQWAQGMASLMDEFDCTLIGGDTVRGSQFTVNITAMGSVNKNRAILRSTAGPKESIFVSGHLGSAAAGLGLSRDFASLPPVDRKRAEPFIKRHLDPYPDVFCGSLLAASGLVTAMQDLSDGLATDLSHIAAQSGLGAVVEAALLPAHEDLDRVATIIGQDPIALQISGGDDYHLIFTVKKGADQELLAYLNNHNGPPVYRVGRTVGGSGVRLLDNGVESDITFRGFEHRGGMEA